MRMVVTGRQGQVATALAGLAGDGLEVLAVGRPELDLEGGNDPVAVLQAARPDIIVNAAAWTAVDLAEQQPERALAVNAGGARAVAEAAARIGVPLIHLSTDYVFDGTARRPYAETDPTGPATAYGRSKLAGEAAVAGAHADHAILRTAWVHAPAGRNFVRTMLDLAARQDEVGVVEDQSGNPTYAGDLALGIVAVARNLLARPDDAGLRGVFHLAGAGDTTWAGFAAAIFAASAARGGPAARVRSIASADRPVPAPRPASSRLDCALIAGRHGVRLPAWQDGLERCLDRIIGPRRAQRSVG
jgi:dTDP-4-dehydrorhamnose reductase